MVFLLIIGSFGIAFLLARGLNSLALIPWRRSAGKHWAERARLLYPARKSARMNLYFIPVNLAMAIFLIAPQINFLFVTIPAFLGALAGNYSMSREIFPELRFASWFHLAVASLLVFFVYWAVLLVAILTMPENFGPWTWLMAGGALILLLAFLFGLGIRLSQGLRLLKPAPERVTVLVGEVSQQMNVPVRNSWLLCGPASNALAMPTTRELIFSEKLLATHPDDEIKAICAHELGHLNEPRKILFLRVLVSLSFFPLVFVRPTISLGENSASGFFALFIIVLVLWLVGIRLSRNMEKRADKIAAENQTDPAVYARALERLYQTNQMPAVMPRMANRAHPDLYDRMVAAGVTPDFPKPAPARSQSWTSYLTVVILVAVPIAIIFVKTFLIAWNASTIQIQ